MKMDIKSDYEKFVLLLAKTYSRDVRSLGRYHFSSLTFSCSNSIIIGKAISEITDVVDTMEKKLKLI